MKSHDLWSQIIQIEKYVNYRKKSSGRSISYHKYKILSHHLFMKEEVIPFYLKTLPLLIEKMRVSQQYNDGNMPQIASVSYKLKWLAIRFSISVLFQIPGVWPICL